MPVELQQVRDLDGRPHDVPTQIANELHALRGMVDLLFPMPWGKGRYVLHAPDALELRWVVYDKTAGQSFAYGSNPLNACVAARERHNREQCFEYSHPHP